MEMVIEQVENKFIDGDILVYKSAIAEKFEAPKDGDVGYDIRSAENCVILPHRQRVISTGLHIAIQKPGIFGFIGTRSSTASQKAIFAIGGIIDPSYRGAIGVILYNGSDEIQKIEKGDKIAQLIFLNYSAPILVNVTDLADLPITMRGQNGFGSTGQ